MLTVRLAHIPPAGGRAFHGAHCTISARPRRLRCLSTLSNVYATQHHTARTQVCSLREDSRRLCLVQAPDTRAAADEHFSLLVLTCIRLTCDSSHGDMRPLISLLYAIRLRKHCEWYVRSDVLSYYNVNASRHEQHSKLSCSGERRTFLFRRWCTRQLERHPSSASGSASTHSLLFLQ